MQPSNLPNTFPSTGATMPACVRPASPPGLADRDGRAATPGAASRRIARVTAHPLRAVLPAPQRTSQGDWTAIEIVVVEVETDGGIVGIGECLARRGAVAYAALHRRACWRRFSSGRTRSTGAGSGSAMRAVLTGRTGGMLIEAIAGIDIALWDIAGQGRRPADREAARRHGPADDRRLRVLDQLARRRAVEREVARARSPPASGRSRSRSARRSRRRIDRGALRAAARRRRDRASASMPTGPTTSTMRSASAACSPTSTMPGSRSRSAPRTGRGYRMLREKLPIRLAAGESDFAAARRARADRGPLDSASIQPDVARAGGISETWRIAELAQCFGVAYAPHVGWSGAVCVAASLQLAGGGGELPRLRVHGLRQSAAPNAPDRCRSATRPP